MSKDPFYDREKQKYDKPVASREFILSLVEKHKSPLSLMEIWELLNAKDEDTRIAIQRRLRAMEREGQLLFNRSKKYCIPDKLALIKGTVIGHRDGFGFLKRADGKPDLFIPFPQMNQLLHGDSVLVKESGKDNRGRTEARVVRVLETRSEPIVGRYFFESGVGIVIPDDSRICQEIIIPPEHIGSARQGNVVVAEITQRPMRRANAVGRIVEVLGEHMAPGMEIEMALRTHGIPHKWPDAVNEQIKSLSEEVPEEAKTGRVNLREMPLVTIDGEDARDFDDAVYCEPEENGGWRLWVAIADVSHYVRTKSALDEEAIERGNSVYFPEQVVPMLPEALSNGLCSLNPNVDRLCMVCEIQISAQGKVRDFQFYEAVMNSHARLTYNKVWDILQGEPELHQRYAQFVPHLRDLYSLYRALSKSRKQRGAIEFETQENKFIFNANRKIDHIIQVHRNDAHKIIEECMILANVCAAQYIEKHQAQALFRVHEQPDATRLNTFLAYLSEVGITYKLSEEPSPKEFADLAKKIDGRPDQELIQTMLLRSMKQAIYSPENLGHFGLALEAYAHFTSPIRRYPDLIVHRAIKAIIDKQAKSVVCSGGCQYPAEQMSMLGEQCSMTERRADDATRDVADWLKCEFMQDHVDDTFDGVISSVTSFGFFVRITEFGIDGLVHISSLQNDYYQFDELKQRLIGENSRRVFRLGDELRVKVASVNLEDRKIDFVLDEPNMEQSGKGKLRGSGRKAKKTSNEGAHKRSKAKDKKVRSGKTTGRKKR